MLSGHLVFVPVLPSHGLLAESRTATISHRVHLWCTRITGVLVATLSFWDFSWISHFSKRKWSTCHVTVCPSTLPGFWPLRGLRIGEAKNPGPRASVGNCCQITIGIVNPTSVLSKAPTFQDFMNCSNAQMSDTHFGGSFCHFGGPKESFSVAIKKEDQHHMVRSSFATS